jgi:hypothetical protein
MEVDHGSQSFRGAAEAIDQAQLEKLPHERAGGLPAEFHDGSRRGLSQATSKSGGQIEEEDGEEVTIERARRVPLLNRFGSAVRFFV